METRTPSRRAEAAREGRPSPVRRWENQTPKIDARRSRPTAAAAANAQLRRRLYETAANPATATSSDCGGPAED